MGGFKKANITVDWAVFGNGPIMVEACDSWDIGTYGVGGELAGLARDIKMVAYAARDFGSLRFYAQKDDSIVAAGIKNVGGTKKLYGDAADWKGKQVAYPRGTTLEYVIGLALAKMGLTTKDLENIAMDVTNANTALRAGSVPVAGLWGNFVYADDITEKFVQVVDPMDVGSSLVTALVATPRAYNDPDKAKAISKWIELYSRAVDYIYESKEHFSELGDVWMEWNEDEGVASTKPECLAQIVDVGNRHFSIKENIDLFEKEVEVGGVKMTAFAEINYTPLQFFHEQGQYDTVTNEMMLSDLCDPSFLKEAYKEYQGNGKNPVDIEVPEDWKNA